MTTSLKQEYIENANKLVGKFFTFEDTWNKGGVHVLYCVRFVESSTFYAYSITTNEWILYKFESPKFVEAFIKNGVYEDCGLVWKIM